MLLEEVISQCVAVNTALRLFKWKSICNLFAFPMAPYHVICLACSKKMEFISVFYTELTLYLLS